MADRLHEWLTSLHVMLFSSEVRRWRWLCLFNSNDNRLIFLYFQCHFSGSLWPFNPYSSHRLLLSSQLRYTNIALLLVIYCFLFVFEIDWICFSKKYNYLFIHFFLCKYLHVLESILELGAFLSFKEFELYYWVK